MRKLTAAELSWQRHRPQPRDRTRKTPGGPPERWEPEPLQYGPASCLHCRQVVQAEKGMPWITLRGHEHLPPRGIREFTGERATLPWTGTEEPLP